MVDVSLEQAATFFHTVGGGQRESDDHYCRLLPNTAKVHAVES